MAMNMLHMPTSKDQSQDLEEKLLLLSRFSEKSSNFQSASLTNKVYKANSDHSNKIYVKPNKKSKKSVLTLPNVPDRMPQEYTVSDVNDGEYLKKYDEHRWRNKCQFPVRYNKSAKQRMNKKENQLTPWKSSGYEGDEKKGSRTSGAHDVWALLRKMNRFQYQPSPTMSDNSFVYAKKNKKFKKNRNTRVYETCHTEEIQYTITSYDVDTAIPKNKSTRACVEQNTSMDDISSCKSSKNINNDAKCAGVNRNAKAAQVGKSVTNKNSQILMEFQNNHNDQGDVIIDYNQSTETLKNQKFSSDSTLTQSVEIASIGTATSSKFYSNSKEIIVRKNIHNIFNNNDMDTTKKDKSLMDKQTASPRKDNNAQTKHNRKNEGPISYNKSNNLTRNSRKRSTIYKVDDNSSNTDIFCKRISSAAHLVEEKKTSKVEVSSDNTKTILDIYRGKLDQASLVDFNKSNLAKCPDKVNLNDIRRKVTNMRFPIVITRHDQISPIKVNTDNYCQFFGTDTQIWPFMMEWMDNKQLKCQDLKFKTLSNTPSQISVKEDLKINKKKAPLERFNRKLKVKPEKIVLSKIESRISRSDCKYNKKTENLAQKIDNVSNVSDQLKSINFNLLKNKMKRLLQKKSTNTVGTIITNSKQPENIYSELEFQRPMTKIIIKNKVDQNVIKVGFGTESNLMSSNQKLYNCKTAIRKELSSDNLQNNKKKVYTKPKDRRIWAKAKWANDVIDNVLNKLKNGFYYIQQIQQPSTLKKEIDVRIPIVKDNAEIPKSPKIVINNIPGFDVPLPPLEVESLSMNEIAIKQCVSNFTIRFDVIVPNSKLHKTTGASIECLPSEITGLPGNLKCQTTILNTVLPAELCSVIPKIMRMFSETNLKFSLPSVKMTKTEPQLATITELVSRSESRLVSILPPLAISEDLQKIFKGSSSFKMKSPVNTNPKICGCHCNFGEAALINFLDFLKIKMRIPCNVEIPFMIHLNKQRHVCSLQFGEKNVSNALPTKNCKNDSSMTVSTVWKFDVIEILKMIAQYRNTQPFKFTLKSAKLKALAQEINDNICNNIIIRTPRLINNEIIPFSSAPRNNTIQRKFIKKNQTNENDNKNYSLCKITNFEEFLQILGSGLANSCVFDEKAGKKIMSCVTKMKKWVAEIDIKQAMLIILLTIKCDSQDMVKFGPKLLQSVGQNIITNTSQLEKEIDALKHRKFLYGDKKPSLTTKTEKGDLFQELYWIAKTAAKHSNGTFDKNAEENLRIFLEKRRQLNPSFLRAMATYLGLGLLTIDLERNK